MGPSIHLINLYCDGSLYDTTGGNAYHPPPPPSHPDNLLQEDGFRILAENGNYIALES